MNEPYVMARTPWGHILGGTTTEHPKDELLDTTVSLINPKLDDDVAFLHLCQRLGFKPIEHGYCRPKERNGYSDFFIRFKTPEQAMRVRLSIDN